MRENVKVLTKSALVGPRPFPALTAAKGLFSASHGPLAIPRAGKPRRHAAYDFWCWFSHGILHQNMSQIHANE